MMSRKRLAIAVAELEAERDTIARARDCGAEPHDPCALPPGNTCDRHLLLAAMAETERLQRLRWQQTWPGMSPGRKKLHLMIDEAEAREEDARRELEKTRKEIRAMQVQQHIDAGRVRVPITKAPTYSDLVRGFTSFPGIGMGAEEAAQIRDRVVAAGGTLPVVIDGKVVGSVSASPAEPGRISWSVSRGNYRAGEAGTNDGVPVVCTHVGAAPSANLQAPDLVDALPEYQLAPVEREAPARVLAVLTRR